MDHKAALGLLNELLGLELGITFRADELKGRKPDPEDGGTRKMYLSATDCAELSKAFGSMADLLGRSEETDARHRNYCGPACPRHQCTGLCDLLFV